MKIIFLVISFFLLHASICVGKEVVMEDVVNHRVDKDTLYIYDYCTLFLLIVLWVYFQERQLLIVNT